MPCNRASCSRSSMSLSRVCRFSKSLQHVALARISLLHLAPSRAHVAPLHRALPLLFHLAIVFSGTAPPPTSSNRAAAPTRADLRNTCSPYAHRKQSNPSGFVPTSPKQSHSSHELPSLPATPGPPTPSFLARSNLHPRIVRSPQLSGESTWRGVRELSGPLPARPAGIWAAEV